MQTHTKTEFAVKGLKPDGTWRTLGRIYTSADYAQRYLEEYILDTKRLPHLYTAYSEYKIAKRTVTTTYTEWEEI